MSQTARTGAAKCRNRHIQLLTGAGMVLAIRMAGGGLLFLTQVIVAQWLGLGQFGIFSYAWAWVNLIAIFACLGLPVSSVRFIPQYRAQAAGETLLAFVRWAWKTTFGSGIALAAVIIVAIIALKDQIEPDLWLPLIVAVAATPLVAVALLQRQVGRAAGFVVLSYLPLQVVRPVLFLGLGFVILQIVPTPDAATFIFASTLAYGVVVLFQGRSLLRFFKRFALATPGASLAVPAQTQRRLWLRTSLPMLAFSVTSVVMIESGIIMVGTLLPPEDTGIYTAVARTSSLITMITMAVDAMTVPRFSALLHGGAAREELDGMLKTLVRWTFAAAAAVMSVLVVGGDLILGLFGPGFDDGYGALLVLAGGFTLTAALAPAPAILNVSGYQDIVTWASIGVVAVNIAAGILLISQFGIMGGALTTALSAILLRASLLGIVWRRLGVLGVIAPPAFGRSPEKDRATAP